MAKPIKIWDGSEWVDVAINVPSLDSPAFTGTPTAPTASLGTDTTQIATTAFVKAEIANSVVEPISPFLLMGA